MYNNLHAHLRGVTAPLVHFFAPATCGEQDLISTTTGADIEAWGA